MLWVNAYFSTQFSVNFINLVRYMNLMKLLVYNSEIFSLDAVILICFFLLNHNVIIINWSILSANSFFNLQFIFCVLINLYLYCIPILSDLKFYLKVFVLFLKFFIKLLNLFSDSCIHFVTEKVILFQIFTLIIT